MSDSNETASSHPGPSNIAPVQADDHVSIVSPSGANPGPQLSESGHMAENVKCMTRNANPSEDEPPPVPTMNDQGPLKVDTEKEEKDDREEKNKDAKDETNAKDEDGQVKEGKLTEEKREDSGVVRRIRDKIQDELSCTICNEVFIDVRATTSFFFFQMSEGFFCSQPQLLPCQHVFCSFCLLQWKKKCTSGHYDCPNCRQKIGKEKVHPNRYLENLISSWMEELGPEHLKQREDVIQERKDQEVKFQAEEATKKRESKRGRSRRGGGRTSLRDYFGPAGNYRFDITC